MNDLTRKELYGRSKCSMNYSEVSKPFRGSQSAPHSFRERALLSVALKAGDSHRYALQSLKWKQSGNSPYATG